MDNQEEKRLELPAGLQAVFDQQNNKKRSRVILSNAQQEVLSRVLDVEAFPSKEKRIQLAQQLGIEARTVQIWFQNQRQKVRKTARMRRLDRYHEQQQQRKMMASRMMMEWSAAAAAGSPNMPGVSGMMATPKLSYSGPDRSEELNALVDAAVDELTKNFSQVASAITGKPVETGKQVESVSAPTTPTPVIAPAKSNETPQERLLKAIPLSLLRSPKFRPRQHKSANTSPKLKTLQPRSQPNTGSASEQSL